LNPKLSDAYVNLVTGLRMLGRMDAADSVLGDALSRFPEDEKLRSLQP
jgi:hypothetical protein